MSAAIITRRAAREELAEDIPGDERAANDCEENGEGERQHRHAVAH